jgi:phospholipase C
VSYATAYYNAGFGVHPSEPNYVWAEAGSDFGVHTDADPSPANGNSFYDHSNHLTAQFNAAGIPWKNYQEDVEFSASPTNSASGTATTANPFNGSSQFGYAVKHNPMAFFAAREGRESKRLARAYLRTEQIASKASTTSLTLTSASAIIR